MDSDMKRRKTSHLRTFLGVLHFRERDTDIMTRLSLDSPCILLGDENDNSHRPPPLATVRGVLTSAEHSARHLVSSFTIADRLCDIVLVL